MSFLRDDCREFRAALLQALEGRPVPAELTALSWHEHLLFCGDCRTLLEREEALEELLATLPDPKLPPDLVRRVSARLRAMREEHGRLDQLLDLAEMTTPAGLAERVTLGVRAELALDRLLDQDRVVVPEGLAARVRREVALDRLLELEPSIEIPSDLAAGVLRAVEPEREESFVPLRPWYRQVRTPYLWAAAAGFLLLVLSPWLRHPDSTTPGGGERVAVNATGDPTEQAILDELDVLLAWDEEGEARDLHETLAEMFDEGDEVLLSCLGDNPESLPGNAADPRRR